MQCVDDYTLFPHQIGIKINYRANVIITHTSYLIRTMFVCAFDRVYIESDRVGVKHLFYDMALDQSTCNPFLVYNCAVACNTAYVRAGCNNTAIMKSQTAHQICRNIFYFYCHILHIIHYYYYYYYALACGVHITSLLMRQQLNVNI